MKKIIIIGCPGSGKSTLARRLARLTKLSLYHLDMMNWQVDKTTVATEVFIERQMQVLSQDTWIIDGNYGSTLDLRIKACDTIVFLDYPLDICLEGVKNRIGKFRPDMPWVEESLDQEFVEFIKGFSQTSRPKILNFMNLYPKKTWYQFKSREETELFLKTIKKSFKS